jgi:serine protease Do
MVAPWAQRVRRVLMATLLLGFGCRDERLPGYFAPPDTRPELSNAGASVDALGSSADPDASPPKTPHGDSSDGPGSIDARGPDPRDELLPSFAPLFRKLKASVVNVYTQEVIERQRLLPWSLAFEPDEPFGTSLGSGMILDELGHILTNAHVVENAAEIRIRFHDESEQPARLVGLDPIRDLAVLKVDGLANLVPVEPGDSDALEVGDWVVAIGNPLGLTHTMTKGIVSAKGRSELSADKVGYLDLIQTDAAINQGSSGGPLFDVRGRVVGVNTALSAEGRGISFAIGWNAVTEALPRLMQGGQVSRSWLGVYVRQARDTGTDDGEQVIVSGVVEGSPAARAGLMNGDVVRTLDEKPVRSVAEFRSRVASAVAGREMLIEVERQGLPLQVIAVLEEAPNIR